MGMRQDIGGQSSIIAWAISRSF